MTEDRNKSGSKILNENTLTSGILGDSCRSPIMRLWANVFWLNVFWVLVLGFVVSPSTVSAFHPFHVCIGQMRWNEAQAHWEVSLRMHPHDLEVALQAIHGRSISLESDDFNQHARRFLENQFMLVALPKETSSVAANESLKEIPTFAKDDTQGSENRSQLRWVGMESERGWLWIHFELIPPVKREPGDQLHLVHRIFLDRIDKQENSVAILSGGLDLAGKPDRSALQFKKGDAIRPMPVVAVEK